MQTKHIHPLELKSDSLENLRRKSESVFEFFCLIVHLNVERLMVGQVEPSFESNFTE